MQMSCSPHSGLPWGLRRESLINAGLREEKKGDSLPVPCSQWSPRTNLLFSLKLQATGGGGCPPCSERCSQLSPQEKLEAATGREDQGTEGVLQCCTLGLETFPPLLWGFPMAQEVKDPPARQGATGDLGSTPGLGRPPGGGNGNPVQCSCLENPMGRGAWWATVRRVTDSDMPEHRAHRHGEPAMVEQGAVRKQTEHWAAAAPWPGTAPAHSTALLLADLHATGTDVVQSRVQLQAVSFVSMQLPQQQRVATAEQEARVGLAACLPFVGKSRLPLEVGMSLGLALANTLCPAAQSPLLYFLQSKRHIDCELPLSGGTFLGRR